MIPRGAAALAAVDGQGVLSPNGDKMATLSPFSVVGGPRAEVDRRFPGHAPGSPVVALPGHPPPVATLQPFTSREAKVRFQITGKQIDVGEALQSHVKTEMSEALAKYAGRPTDAQVVFSREGHLHACEATVHLSTGLTAQARGTANEIYAAFDACNEKMEKQLRRNKRRLKDHHKERPQPVEYAGGSAYILAAPDDDSDDGEAGTDPVIIAEMETRIASLSVGEAVLQMELAGAPLLVFRNEKTGGTNVVYRREDGNYGWIDPAAAK